jgi:hypothetical protein
MFDLLFIATVVATFLFLSVVIIKNDRKPKYEIRYIRGWFVIFHVKTYEILKRFATLEEAEIWFNKNCKDV